MTYAVTQPDRAERRDTLTRFCARCVVSQPVSLDQTPSLHPLRRRLLGLVHGLHRVLRICPTSRDRASPASVLRPSRRGPAGHSPAGQSRDLPGSDAFLCSVMCSPTPAERQPLAWRDRTCCLRRCLPSRPLRPWVLHGTPPLHRCVRFAAVVTNDHATLATGRPLRLTRAGLAPAGPRQLAWRTSNPSVGGACFVARAPRNDKGGATTGARAIRVRMKLLKRPDPRARKTLLPFWWRPRLRRVDLLRPLTPSRRRSFLTRTQHSGDEQHRATPGRHASHCA